MMEVCVAVDSGYRGLELIQRLLRHSKAALIRLSSETYAGRNLAEVFSHLSGLCSISFSSIEELPADDLDLIFLARYLPYPGNLIEGHVFVDSGKGSSESGRTPSEKIRHLRRSLNLAPCKLFRRQHLREIRPVLDNRRKRAGG